MSGSTVLLQALELRKGLYRQSLPTRSACRCAASSSLPYTVSSARIAAYFASSVTRFTRRFSSFLLAPVTSTYMIYLDSDDGSIVFVNGVLMINNNGECCPGHAITVQDVLYVVSAAQLNVRRALTCFVDLRHLDCFRSLRGSWPVTLMASKTVSS